MVSLFSIVAFVLTFVIIFLNIHMIFLLLFIPSWQQKRSQKEEADYDDELTGAMLHNNRRPPHPLNPYGWTPQKRYRVWSLSCLVISNVLHLTHNIMGYIFDALTSNLSWTDANTATNGYYFYTRPILNDFFCFFFNLAIMFYAFCVIDRFRRIQMVLPKSRMEVFLTAFNYTLIFICVACFLINSTCVILNSITLLTGNIFFDYRMCDNLSYLTGILSLLMPFLVVVMEFYCNIKLILTSLRSIKRQVMENGNSTDALNIETAVINSTLTTPVNALFDFKIRKYSRLRLKMIILFILLMLSDMLDILFSALGSANILSADDSLLIASSFAGVHVYFSFSLLDLFLRELNNIKRLAAVKNGKRDKKQPQFPMYVSPTFQSRDTSQNPVASEWISESHDVCSALQSYSAFSPSRSNSHKVYVVKSSKVEEKTAVGPTRLTYLIFEVCSNGRKRKVVTAADITLEEEAGANHWSHFKRYKLLSLVILEVSFIFHLANSIIRFKMDEEGKNPFFEEYFLPIMLTGSFYNWAFQLALFFYALGLIDRFERLQMVLKNSRLAALLAVFHGWLAFLLSLTILPSLVNNIISIYSYYIPFPVNLDTWSLIVDTMTQLSQLVLPASVIILELFSNIKLVHTTLYQWSFSLSTNNRTLNLKIIEYRRLKTKMLGLFFFLTLLDITIFTQFIMAGISMLPRNETDLVASSFTGIHFWISYALLDIFLKELQRVKKVNQLMEAAAAAASPQSPTFDSKDTSIFSDMADQKSYNPSCVAIQPLESLRNLSHYPYSSQRGQDNILLHPLRSQARISD